MGARTSARRAAAADDRRRARSAATRAAVVEAVLALLEGGDPLPAMPRIAARAGVSLRSVFQHFADREALYAAVSDRQTARVAALTAPIDPRLPVAARAAALAAQRARVFALIAPVRRAALLLAGRSPAIASRLAAVRAAQRREVRRLFAAELRRLPAPQRRRRAAIAAAVCGFSTWHVLRVQQGLSAAAAERAVAEALVALLE
jgi:AcrR family transcriptional regulator